MGRACDMFLKYLALERPIIAGALPVPSSARTHAISAGLLGA